MANYLINLENFSLDDYFELDSYIQEQFITESSQSREVEKLISRMKKINSDLASKKINKLDSEEVKAMLQDLDKVSKDLRKKNINKYTTIAIITQTVEFVDKVVGIASFINDALIQPYKTKKAEINKAMEALSPEELQKLIDTNKLEEYLSNVLPKVSFGTKIKNMAIDAIKDFFSVKNLVKTALMSINSMIGSYAKNMKDYEYSMDKGYELLVSCEARMMMEKRKAQKRDDKSTEAACDEVIEFVENLKKQRLRAKNEAVVLESDKTEMNVNSFKIVCRDIAESLRIEKENIKAYTDTALYIVRRAVETTEENKDKKLELMEKKIEATEKFVKDPDRTYDRKSINVLLHKYSNLFSNKYSNFGLKARENFENTLGKYVESLYDLMGDYLDDMAKILDFGENKRISVDIISNALEDKIGKKISRTTFLGIKRMLYEIADNAAISFEMTNSYVDWCRETINTKELKSSFKFKILHGLFKNI